MFVGTRWRLYRTWTRKNSWSQSVRGGLMVLEKNKKHVLSGPEVANVLPLYKVAIVFNKVQSFNNCHPISRTWFALYRGLRYQLWLINYESLQMIRPGNSKWQALMNQERDSWTAAWILMKVSLVISGPSGPDELTNCLTWNDIDWLWLRYQVMFWSWTGFVTSFDLLNTHDYDKLLRIVLIHINYHNNIFIIPVNLR